MDGILANDRIGKKVEMTAVGVYAFPRGRFRSEIQDREFVMRGIVSGVALTLSVVTATIVLVFVPLLKRIAAYEIATSLRFL